jgi:hypothetical protein
MAALVFSVACGGSNPEPETPTNNAPTTSTPESTSATPGDGTGSDVQTGGAMGGMGGVGGMNGAAGDTSIPEGIAGSSGTGHPVQ